MKYANVAGRTCKENPISTSVGLVGAVAATVAAARYVNTESTLLKLLALATASVAGFAFAYGGARLTDKSVTFARHSSMFSRQATVEANKDAPAVTQPSDSDPIPGFKN